MSMRAQFVIPVIVSILILGTLGLSQEAYATTPDYQVSLFATGLNKGMGMEIL